MTRSKKPQQSPALKRLLAIKFPTHAGTSPESEYARAMGRPQQEPVDVTLRHNGNVIHCNDPRGRSTAAKYLKAVQS